MYEEYSSIASNIKNIFKIREISCNLIINACFTQNNIKSIYYGSETRTCLGPKYGVFGVLKLN